MPSERVHSLVDYWEGPRSGVADLHGMPHTFECVFDELADQWSDLFVLQPIDAGTLALVQENWARWLRWQAAFDRGEVGMETHPVLPDERPDYGKCAVEIRRRLEAREAPKQRWRGKFEGEKNDWRVIWSAE